MKVRELLLHLKGRVDSGAGEIPGVLDRIAKLAAIATTAAAAFATALAQATLEAASYADGLRKAGRDIGATVAQLQALHLAADLSGTSTEHLRGGLSTLQRQLAAAAKGSAEAQAALARVGLSAEDIHRPVTEVFGDLLDGLNRMPAGAQRSATAMVLLGEAGGRMGTLIEGGSAAIRDASAALGGMNALISDKQAERAERLLDSITMMRARFHGLSTAIGLLFVPVAERVVRLLDRMLRAIGPTAYRVFEAAARAVAVAMDFLATPLGKVVALLAGGAAVAGIVSFSKALLTWISGLKTVAPLIQAFTAVFGGVSLTTLAAVAAGVLAVGLAIDDLIVFAQGGKSAIGGLFDLLLGAGGGETVRQILSDLAVVFRAVGEAIWDSLPGYDDIVSALQQVARWGGIAMDAIGGVFGVGDVSQRISEATAAAQAGARSFVDARGADLRNFSGAARMQQTAADAAGRISGGEKRRDVIQEVTITNQGVLDPVTLARAIDRELQRTAAEARAEAR